MKCIVESRRASSGAEKKKLGQIEFFVVLATELKEIKRNYTSDLVTLSETEVRYMFSCKLQVYIREGGSKILYQKGGNNKKTGARLKIHRISHFVILRLR